MNLKETIEELVNRILAASDRAEELFLVEVTIAGNPKAHPKVTVLVDGDTGVDIDTCALISRRLGNQIEELNLLENAYVLEVSSPGLDLPLQQKRQYTKNIGRKIKVLLKDGSTKTGKLTLVDADSILLEEETPGNKKKAAKETEASPARISWEDISKTNVMVSF
jgi:ribosome maturation factor RimP